MNLANLPHVDGDDVARVIDWLQDHTRHVDRRTTLACMIFLRDEIRRLDAHLEQEQDIRRDRETVLALIGERLSVKLGPHQTYTERLLEAVAQHQPKETTMATLNNPGKYDCMAKLQANPDMPYFLLLGSDPLAAKCVRDWAARAAQAGVNPEKVAEAAKLADDMEAWQKANDAKVPD